VLWHCDGGTVITTENAHGWTGPLVDDEADPDLYEPASVVVLALLIVAASAAAMASLPAAIAVGLSPVQVGVGFGSLAVLVMGVLGGVKLVAVVRGIGHRALARSPASVIIAFRD
jgi:hypothetical protein